MVDFIVMQMSSVSREKGYCHCVICIPVNLIPYHVTRSCKGPIAIHAKKPTESWEKAVKNMSSHQKLSEWQKVASRFTEIVYKSSSEDSRTKLSASFQAICRPLGFSKTKNNRATEYLWHRLAPANSAWVCWLCWCSGNYTVKHKRDFIFIWMNCAV